MYGNFTTLDDLGWTPASTPSATHGLLQSRLNQGPLALMMPMGPSVYVDQGLVAPYPLHLVGHGGDVALTGGAPSQFRCTTPNQNILQLLADNSSVEAVNFQADVIGASGYGVLIGDGAARQPWGVTLDRVSTGSNNWRGIGLVSGQQMTLRTCFAYAQDAAVVIDNENSDAGDNHVSGGKFVAYGTHGACFRLLSGGGINIQDSAKLLDAYVHIQMAWNKGGSGGLQVVGCSLENCHGPISIDMDGTKPFVRAIIDGNSFGNYSVAVAVRNFQAAAWLTQLVVVDNGVQIVPGTAFGKIPAFDFGSVGQVSVSENNIDGGGACYAGIVARDPCAGWIGPNLIRNCDLQVQDLTTPSRHAMEIDAQR